MWNRNHSCCSQCKGTERPHMAGGLCRYCYLKNYAAKHASKIAKQKHKWHETYVVGTDRGKLAREQRHYDGLREPVLKRDGYKCQRCGSTKSLVVHHKDRKGRGDRRPHNEMANLETLCRACHIQEHRDELIAKRRANGWKQPKPGRWSRKWDACRRCNTTKIQHASHGYCRNCKYYENKVKI